jgi:hypothetical protein
MRVEAGRVEAVQVWESDEDDATHWLLFFVTAKDDIVTVHLSKELTVLDLAAAIGKSRASVGSGAGNLGKEVRIGGTA